MIPAMIAVGALAVLLATVVTVRRRVVVVQVSGLSMAPTVQHGDRLVVRRAPGERLRVGAIVVIDEPGPCRPGRPETPRWVVKRVVAVPGDPVPAALAGAMRGHPGTVPPGHLLLLGDNAEHSRDSRHFGPARTDRVLGVVLRRLGGAPLAAHPAGSAV